MNDKAVLADLYK